MAESDGGQSHPRAVAPRLSFRMCAAVGFQPGHRQRPAEERGPGQSLRLLPRHAPAAGSGGKENVRARLVVSGPEVIHALVRLFKRIFMASKQPLIAAV